MIDLLLGKHSWCSSFNMKGKKKDNSYELPDIFTRTVFKKIWIHESKNNLLYFEINHFYLIAPWFRKPYSIEI